MLSNEVRIVNGRIVPTNIFFKDANTKDRTASEILEDIQDVKEDIAECKREGRFYGDIQEELKDLEKELSEATDSKTKDGELEDMKKLLAKRISERNPDDALRIKELQDLIEEIEKKSKTKDTYSEQRKALEAKLKQAQEDGDTAKAKEIQEEINELIKSGEGKKQQRSLNEETIKFIKSGYPERDSKDCQSKDIGFGGKGYKCKNCGATDSIAGKIKHVKDVDYFEKYHREKREAEEELRKAEAKGDYEATLRAKNLLADIEEDFESRLRNN